MVKPTIKLPRKGDRFTTFVDWKTGALGGDGIQETTKCLGQIAGIFADGESWGKMDPATPVYRVQYWKPVQDGTSGGLFWGNSTIFPGKVGEEYFMTKGHFHARIDHGEFYATISGGGVLVMMDLERQSTCLEMTPGTVHYIPAATAHRVVNTGKVPLRFLACWGSDAGHDYKTIENEGFSVRILEVDGKPAIIDQL